jgi:hypothetical protein
MLTNFELEDLCAMYDVPLNGIYMKDQLPKRIKTGNYIINLQSSSEGNGTHFTGLVVKNKDVCFYDSFGGPPPIQIRTFVKTRPNAHLGFNNWIIQDLKSDNCGYFVLSLFVYLQHFKHQNIYKIINNYVNMFKDDTKQNDGILRKTFKSFGKSHPLIDRLYNQ